MKDDANFFAELFALWAVQGRAARGLSRDMGVPYRRATQWIARQYLPPGYWRRFIDVLRLRFDRVVTLEHLVDASCEMQARHIEGAKKAAAARRARVSDREVSP